MNNISRICLIIKEQIDAQKETKGYKQLLPNKTLKTVLCYKKRIFGKNTEPNFLLNEK
jgi:hypothetical protein